MFLQKLSSFLFAATTTLTLGTALLAQGGFTGALGGVLGSTTGTMWQPITPPTLPSLEWRTNSYDRTIGNSWLGGSVHAYANMLRQKYGTYELGFANVELRGVAKVLNVSKEVFEIVGQASNQMSGGVQTRAGGYRIDVLGATIVDQSFTNSSTFASTAYSLSLFPSNISVSVPVGPISVTIGGNAGCGAGRSANWLLPAATATVGLNATGSVYAFANASVSFGIPGFNVGVGLQGRILEQTLNANLSASAVWGLSGGVTYMLKAITLQLYAWATALYTWTTNLCSWSAGQVTLNLI